jgi:uncharacterized protein YkwD
MIVYEEYNKRHNCSPRCTKRKGFFCSHHQSPENHKYTHAMQTPPPDSQPHQQQHHHYNKKKSKAKTAIIPLLFIVMLTITYVLVTNNNTNFNLTNNNPQKTDPQPTIQETTTNEELIQYALDLINKDRNEYGLQNVTLSTINSAQLHAEDMLKESYFSHWNLNGNKPYMRYTLANGKGAVSENCAYQWVSKTTINAKETLKKFEWSMMYDDAHANWGHRDNILNPLHNKVSIGIAYNKNSIYLVQDFENDYISWNMRNTNNNHQINLAGTISAGYNIQNIMIFYDNPTQITTNQIKQQYQGSYDQGAFVTSVVQPAPPGTYYIWDDNQIGIEAKIWIQNNDNFQINFDLSKAVDKYGAGVYTIYLLSGASTADSLTTYSIWIT